MFISNHILTAHSSYLIPILTNICLLHHCVHARMTTKDYDYSPPVLGEEGYKIQGL